MDRSFFMLSSFLGLGVALAVFLSLGSKRRASISSPAWWSFLGMGSVLCLYGLSHSTAPSFAHRTTVTGKASAFAEVRYGRNSKFTFSFVPEGENPIDIETHIIVPHWGNTTVFAERRLRVTYLKDSSRSARNEAIDIAILSGENAGWMDSLDARPFGIWLAVPIGAFIAGFGYLGIKYRKDDLEKIEASDASSFITP